MFDSSIRKIFAVHSIDDLPESYLKYCYSKHQEFVSDDNIKLECQECNHIHAAMTTNLFDSTPNFSHLSGNTSVTSG
jgi:hypothetical protein